MSVKSITIDLPSDILTTLNESESELAKDIKLSLAIRLYTLQKLSVGKAAQVAGLPRIEFENLLSENGIPVSNLTIEDVDKDFEKLR